jgi:hypothetical protein
MKKTKRKFVCFGAGRAITRLFAGRKTTMSSTASKPGFQKSWRITAISTRHCRRLFQDNTAQLNMRLPPAMKAVLSKLARQRTTDATTLARIWLAERLKQELKAG